MRRNYEDDAAAPASAAAEVGAWIGRAAFVLALGVVIARATVLEYLRDPFGVTPGSAAIASAPGPSTAVVMDAIAALPALLVLLRAVIDCAFILRRSKANALMAALAGWIALAVLRADDRFAAAVDAANLIAAMTLLWAMQQLVRDWRTMRIVAGVIFGLLLIYAAHAAIDHLVEMPARQENFRLHAAETMKNLNIDPNSFEADRLMRKINSGELLGFSATINTFAAVLVVAGVVAVGAVIQRLKDREEPIVAVFMIVLVAGAVPALIWTSSHTAFATPVIAMIWLAIVWLFGSWLNTHRRIALAIVLALVALGTTLIVVVGMTNGKLYQDSLNFRWWYWRGAFSVWRERPLMGVGLDSFANHYLAYRLPIASEEPKDPHNFVVKAFCELGLIGGVLTLLWVGRAGWEMTWPSQLALPDETPVFRNERLSDLGKFSITFLAGTVIAVLMAVDFTQINWEAAIELLKRLLYLCLGVIGGAMLALRSMQHQRIEDRPAPWLRTAMVIAVLIFLVHNLIDFSMFESSAMFFAAALAGACWGAGLPAPTTERRGIAFARLGVAGAVWIAAIVALVAPTIAAESAAADGDGALRHSRFTPAATAYRQAFDQWPGNADYAFRAAMAIASSPQPDLNQVHALLDQAVHANPMSSKYYRVRAEFAVSGPQPDVDAMRADYESALRIDPNSVEIRLEYAGMLARLNQKTDAKRQYELAISYNAGLDPADPKRMDDKKIANIRQLMNQLGV